MRLNTGTMPSSLRERVRTALKTATLNPESYSYSGYYISEVRDRVAYSRAHISIQDYGVIEHVFKVRYSDTPERVKALTDWKNEELAKQIFSELGT